MADIDLLGKPLGDILQYSIWGFLNGGIYALIALGIVVINKASGIFNFAHGWLMFVCGMFFWQFFDNDISPQLTFVFSGMSALLIAGVIASMGISTIAAPALASKSATVIPTGEKRLRGWQLWVNKARELVGKAFNRNQVTIFIGAGFLTWVLVGVLLNQDNAILRAATGTFIVAIAIGLLVERFAIRPLLGQPVLTAILMTLAVSFILHGTSQMIWGPQERTIAVFVEEEGTPETQLIRTTPQQGCGEGELVRDPNGLSYCKVININPPAALPDYRLDTEDLLGINLQFQRYLVWGFGVSMATFFGFVILFRYTAIGLAMQATAENQVLAESVGLRVRLVLAIAWALITVMASIGGTLIGMGTNLSMQSTPPLALLVFPAVLLGGLDSITGALVGGITIGLVVQLSNLFLGDRVFAEEVMPFVVLMIVLLIRPNGLFGQKQIERV
jgi:branched-chain amino acid transport system permease protein